MVSAKIVPTRTNGPRCCSQRWTNDRAAGEIQLGILADRHAVDLRPEVLGDAGDLPQAVDALGAPAGRGFPLDQAAHDPGHADAVQASVLFEEPRLRVGQADLQAMHLGGHRRLGPG